MKISESIKTIDKNQIFHVIFSTYRRKEILLNDDIRQQISNIIKDICKKNDIKYFIYKVLTDHVHILLKKKEQQNLSQIMQLIKGVSTFSFFKIYPDFAIDLKRKRLWTRGYYAVEIKNKQQYDRTVCYVRNNKDRFKEEIEILIKAPGFRPVSAEQNYEKTK